jgi:hypothetical protein
MHGPLYHSLAELEARVFNIEGLANLNKRAAEIFQTDATVPPPSSMAMQAWGKKIKGRNAKIPDGIAALAEKVGFDENDSMLGMLDDVDPGMLVDSFGLGQESELLIENKVS